MIFYVLVAVAIAVMAAIFWLETLPNYIDQQLDEYRRKNREPWKKLDKHGRGNWQCVLFEERE